MPPISATNVIPPKQEKKECRNVEHGAISSVGATQNRRQGGLVMDPARKGKRSKSRKGTHANPRPGTRPHRGGREMGHIERRKSLLKSSVFRSRGHATTSEEPESVHTE